MSTKCPIAIEVAEEAFEKCNAQCCEVLKPKYDEWLYSDGTLEDNYKVGEVLGKGGFGIVYAGVSKKDNTRVAIKHIAKAKVTAMEMVNIKGLFSNRLFTTSFQLNGRKVPLELKLMHTVQSVEGAVKLVDYFERPDSFVIVMERPDSCRDMFDYKH